MIQASVIEHFILLHLRDISVEMTKIDSDGTLHIPAHSFAPSRFVSEEFRKAYAAHLQAVQEWPLAGPTMSASKEEWDKFDAEADRLIFEPSAEAAERHYATDIEDTTMAGSMSALSPQRPVLTRPTRIAS
jgi:hypothetical protein